MTSPRRYQIWIASTFKKSGRRPVLIGDDLASLRDYIHRQPHVACEIRTIKTGALIQPTSS